MVAGLFLFPLFEANYNYRNEAKLLLPGFKAAEEVAPASLTVLPKAETKESNLRVLFFGDLMLDRNVGARLKNKNLDLLLGGLASSTDFNQFDVVGANLEGAVTNKGEHYAPEMGFDFAFSPERVKELKKYNFSYFTIANNHISDQGEKGVEETRSNLSNLNFDYSGAPDAQISDNSVTIISRQNKKIALVALSMVYNHFSLEKLKKIIENTRPQVDWVIVNIHWGNEYQHNRSLNQQSIGRELIDSGADVIIGHHPHVVQGIEIYKNRPIFYSLGNFVFDQYFSPDTQEGLGVELELKEKNIIINLKPISSVRSAVNLMSAEKKNKFLDNLATWSQAEEGFREQIRGQIINIAK
jgi:poly-gamma-glutamate synthesis protein (capsule biosynthesis protein)